jgi:hypothetical protein
MLNSNERIIKHKVGLLNLAEELGNVSKACQMLGLSRDTFYRYKLAVAEGGIASLIDRAAAGPIPRIVRMRPRKRRSLPMPLPNLPMASCAPAMN